MAPIVYLIRHGEKPPKLPDGEDDIGLSAQGLTRAQALVQVFGKKSKYDIQYILAQKPKKDGKRARPYETIRPLAEYLDCKLNIKIDRDAEEEVAAAIKSYDGPGNILVCWEHKQLNDVARALGVANPEEWPSRFDIIWTLDAPYDKITSISSQHVPGLDDAYAKDP